MFQSSISITYRKTNKLDHVSRHGLLASVYQFAQRIGVFDGWEQMPLKMKTVTYRPLDKLQTLWASIIIGCEHTYDINTELGAHEYALSRMMGLERFPDQSQVSRLLTRSDQEVVEWFRGVHFQMLCRMTRSRKRSLWQPLANRRRCLMADLDQRGIVVSGKQFELAERGYFGRHRGHTGYRLSVLFLGGEIGEVIDEHLDSGNLYLRSRLEEMVNRLAEFCERQRIAPSQVILRGDAELGTPAAVAMVESYGFKYLFKGISAQKAKKLAAEVKDCYLLAKPNAEGGARWTADLGSRLHRDQSADGAGHEVECRTLVMTSIEPARRARKTKHHGKKQEAAEKAKRWVRSDYFLTNLTASELPTATVLDLYDERETIESYFHDERHALGAQHVRTWCHAGSQLFQWLVASVNNLLRWYRHEVLKGTEFEEYGLKRIIGQLMQIGARLTKQGRRWLIEVPQRHAQAMKLLHQWQDGASP